MRQRHYILNDDHTVAPVDLMEWARWFETTQNRIVRVTKIGKGEDAIRVSTAFLGLDHGFADDGPPMLFETMIFGGEKDGEQMRCSTYEQAVAQHEAALGEL